VRNTGRAIQKNAFLCISNVKIKINKVSDNFNSCYCNNLAEKLPQSSKMMEYFKSMCYPKPDPISKIRFLRVVEKNVYKISNSVLNFSIPSEKSFAIFTMRKYNIDELFEK
jgi:hypothetical protein